MRLYKPSLTVLVENSERVSFRLINDTDGLWTRCHVRSGKQIRRKCGSLKLDEVVELVVADDVCSGTNLCSFTQILRKHGYLHEGIEHEHCGS